MPIQTAYNGHRGRVSDKTVVGLLLDAEENRLRYKLIKTPLKGYEVRYQHVISWYTFYIFDGVRAIAIFEAEPENAREWASLLVPGIRVVTPHVMFHPDYRGLGLATKIYLMAMSGKFALVTTGHTTAAKVLWDRLSNHPQIRSVYANEYSPELVSPSSPLVRRAARLMAQAKYFLHN